MLKELILTRKETWFGRDCYQELSGSHGAHKGKVLIIIFLYPLNIFFVIFVDNGSSLFQHPKSMV